MLHSKYLPAAPSSPLTSPHHLDRDLLISPVKVEWLFWLEIEAYILGSIIVTVPLSVATTSFQLVQKLYIVFTDIRCQKFQERFGGLFNVKVIQS